MARDIDEDEDRDERDDEEERPRKKKKKKKKEKATQKNWMPYILIAGGGGLLITLLVITVIVVIVVKKGAKDKVTPVTEYVNYATPEDVFHVDLPKDWDQESGGKKSMFFVKAKKGGAEIFVNENIVGSLKADIAGAAQPDLNAPDELQPFARVHEDKRAIYEDEYSGYKEEPAITVRCSFGKARRSTFTASKGFGKIKGYRATVVSAMTQITVTCICSTKDWDMLEPAFAHAIESLGYGPGKSSQ